ncbi:hypothetical protein [Phenylobacterium sp.]|uniref:hypothetical protein n=1 Tax=Phenylobacterium sp. TaxID=1871053 RepID=UPI0030F4A560
MRAAFQRTTGNKVADIPVTELEPLPVKGVNSDGSPAPSGSSADPSYASGYGFDIAASPATTNGAYAAGDVMGGFLEFTVANLNDAPVLITGIQVTFKAAVQPNLRAIFLSAAPSALLADNDPYTLTATNALLVRKSLSSVALGASYTSHGTPKSISLAPNPFVMKPYSGGKKIGVYIIDDSGVTLTSTSDMQVRVSGLGA